MGELRIELDDRIVHPGSAFRGHIVIGSPEPFALCDIFVELREDLGSTAGSRVFDRVVLNAPDQTLPAGRYNIPFTYAAPKDCRGEMFRYWLKAQVLARFGFDGPLKAEIVVPIGRECMRLPPHVFHASDANVKPSLLSSTMTVELESDVALRGSEFVGQIVIENHAVFKLGDFRIHLRSVGERFFSNFFKEITVKAPHEPLQPGRYLVGFRYPLPEQSRTDCQHVLEIRSSVEFGFTGRPECSALVRIVKRLEEEEENIAGAALTISSMHAGYLATETELKGSVSVHCSRPVPADAIVVTAVRVKTESGTVIALSRNELTVLTPEQLPAGVWAAPFTIELPLPDAEGMGNEFLLVAELQRPHGRVTTVDLRVPIVPQFVQPYLTSRPVSVAVNF